MKRKNSAAQGRLVRASHGTARATRAEGDSGTKVGGVGVRYGAITEIYPGSSWGFFERFAAGCFVKPEGRDCLSRYNHSQLLGRESNGTLVLDDNAETLDYEVAPNPETQAGRDCLARAGREDLGGASFEFSDIAWSVEKNYKDGKPLFTITKAYLYEVGPVDSPAYLQTSAELRSGENMVDEDVAKREFERRMAGPQTETRSAEQEREEQQRRDTEAREAQERAEAEERQQREAEQQAEQERQAEEQRQAEEKAEQERKQAEEDGDLELEVAALLAYEV